MKDKLRLLFLALPVDFRASMYCHFLCVIDACENDTEVAVIMLERIKSNPMVESDSDPALKDAFFKEVDSIFASVTK